MDPEQLSAELRPRSSWEAIDFGVALMRRAWALTGLTWVMEVGLAYTLVWVLLWTQGLWAMLLLWALKPLFGRLPLRVLSASLFGARLRVSELLWGLPRQWLAEVFVWRWRASRGAHSAVTLLEGLRGGSLRMRWSALAPGLSGPSLSLITVCVCLRWWMLFSLLFSALYLIPERLAPDLGTLFSALFEPDAPLEVRLLWMVCDFTAWSLAELLYVAGSFGLYVQRRTELEGWDLQQRFHRIARRLRAPKVALLVLLLGLAGPAQAQDTAPPEGPFFDPGTGAAAQLPPDSFPLRPAPQDPKALAEQILADPDFGGTTTRSGRRLRDFDTPDRWRCNAPAPAVPPIGVGLPAPMLYVGLAVLLLLVLWAIFRRSDWSSLADPAPPEPMPDARAGKLEREQVSSHDALAIARRRWAAGDRVGALSALYSGAVSRLVERGVPLSQGQTEGEVLRITHRKRPGAEAEALGRITRGWQMAAYAHILVSEAEFEELLSRWESSFGGEL